MFIFVTDMATNQPSRNPPKFLSLGRAWCQIGQEDQNLAKNDQNTTLGPKLAIFGPILGQFWQNYYFSYVLPHPNFTLGICSDYFWQQNSSQSMSNREPAHFSQNYQIYHFRAKTGRFGLISAKLSLCLSFAAPKFHSWDLF